MSDSPDMEWIDRPFADPIEPWNRKVFGVIQEARVIEPGITAYFVIKCSDGTVIQEEFVYTQNPCEAIGSLVTLELTPENHVGARRFKTIEDMNEAYKARIEAEQRKKRAQEKREQTRVEKEQERNKMLDQIARLRKWR